MRNQIADYFVSSKPGLGLYQGKIKCDTARDQSLSRLVIRLDWGLPTERNLG